MISPQETQAFPLIEQINLSNINHSYSSNFKSHKANIELSKCQIIKTFFLIFILFLLFSSIAYYCIKDDFKYLSKTYRKKNDKPPNLLQFSSLDKKEFTKSDKFFFSIKDTNFGTNQFNSFNKKINSNQILVGSLLDYGLSQYIDFQKLQKQILEQIGYQIIQFKFDDSLQKVEQKLMLNSFKDATEAKQFLLFLSLQTQLNTENHYASDLEYRLGLYLMREPQNQRGLQIQYHIADMKYQIGKKSIELPICIFTMERNIFNKNAYQEYFQSIEALNYSNFKIVYVDDNSSDNSARQIFDYLEKSNMRIKNRIKIIHNQVRIGALANLFFWTKKFCHQNDIVVNIDGDDAFTGKQVLKVISSVYENPDVWYAYSTYTILDPNSGFIEKSKISKELSFKTSEYRRSFQWQTSHIRTYRQQLSQSVPIYSMIQFHYDVESGNAWPIFFSSSADMIYSFALIQMAGNERIRYLNDYFYNYYGSASEKNCYREHQMNDGSKSRAKTPLKKLNHLGEKVQLVENDLISYVDWNWIEFDKNRYTACKQKLNKQSAQK